MSMNMLRVLAPPGSGARPDENGLASRQLDAVVVGPGAGGGELRGHGPVCLEAF
jgi:hypothetical protein